MAVRLSTYGYAFDETVFWRHKVSDFKLENLLQPLINDLAVFSV